MRNPRRAASIPSAIATVEWPTPPLPVTNTSRSCRSDSGHAPPTIAPAFSNPGRIPPACEYKGELRPPKHRSPRDGHPQGDAFANQKGGVAKTTTTLNLAVAFAEEGHRVLCVDMDPQGNLTMSQGIDPDTLQKSMYDVLVTTSRSAR